MKMKTAERAQSALNHGWISFAFFAMRRSSKALAIHMQGKQGMTFFQAVTSVLSKYVQFSGRARRAEYWYWSLFAIIAAICFSILDFALFPRLGWEPLSTVFSIATLLPALAVCVRRLHDIDRSGWWVLLTFIPVIGWLVLIYWAVKRGTTGDNRFGPDPVTDGEPVAAPA